MIRARRQGATCGRSHARALSRQNLNSNLIQTTHGVERARVVGASTARERRSAIDVDREFFSQSFAAWHRMTANEANNGG